MEVTVAVSMGNGNGDGRMATHDAQSRRNPGLTMKQRQATNKRMCNGIGGCPTVMRIELEHAIEQVD